MLIVTAGGWEPHYGPRGVNGPIDDLLFPINHSVLFYPGYDVLLPLIVYQADRMNNDGFRATSDRLHGRMLGPFSDKPIPYRRQNAGDYNIPFMELREDAAASILTVFAAHLQS